MDIGSFVLILVVLGFGVLVVFRKYGSRSATQAIASGAPASRGVAADAAGVRSMTAGAGSGVDPHAAHNRADEAADPAHGGRGCC